jgi:hypothetical protein
MGHQPLEMNIETFGGRRFLLTLGCGDDAFRIDSRQLVGDDVAQLGKPEIRHRRQHRPLLGDGVGQDDVEGGKAVGGDDEQAVGIDGVDIAHLAPGKERQAGEGGIEERGGHGGVPAGKGRIIKGVRFAVTDRLSGCGGLPTLAIRAWDSSSISPDPLAASLGEQSRVAISELLHFGLMLSST